MADYSVDLDLVLDIYQVGISQDGLGFQSRYTTIPHPGTNKTIQGWQWDRRTWPVLAELDSIAVAPSIWDPSSNLLSNDYWQSGIGDNLDLLLLSVAEEGVLDSKKWISKINHGYFYEYQDEYYLFSDDYRIEQFYWNQLESGVQYKDLNDYPRPGIPIKVRRYVWDEANRKYGLDLDLRKRVSFSGTLTGYVEADTENDDGNISYENIDSTKYEFLVDYDYSTFPRVYLNDDYSEAVAESGQFYNYEFVGVGDGTKSKFNLLYSPVDPSGDFEVVTYIDSGNYYWWNPVSGIDDFTPGAAREFKIDKVLGILEFGDYDPTTTSGAGLIPSIGTKVIARYTKGIEVEYEPDTARDFVSFREIDLNPASLSFSKGFLLLSYANEEPSFITLESDYTYDENSGYSAPWAGSVGSLIATVKSNLGNDFLGQRVYFELTSPYVGNLVADEALTNSNGEASVLYDPPDSLDDIAKLATSFMHSGSNTVILVDDLPTLTNESSILLFAINRTDLVLGFPESGVNGEYSAYIAREGYEVDPDGTAASVDFEKDYREQFDLPVVEEYDDTDSTMASYGVKIVSSAIDANMVHPHSGVQDSAVRGPVFPIRYSAVGTATELIYGSLLTPPIETVKGYLAVTETPVYARAYFLHPRTQKKVYSNTITLNVSIEDESDGIVIYDDVADVPSGLFREVRNINNLSNADILTWSGLLYDAYLDERLVSGDLYHRPLPLEDSTIALYRFDGNYADEADSNRYTYGSSIDFVEKNKFWDRGIYVNGSSDYVFTDDLMTEFPAHSGSLEFHYRAPYADYALGSGSDQHSLCYLVGRDSSHNVNGLYAVASGWNNTPILSLHYLASGQDWTFASAVQDLSNLNYPLLTGTLCLANSVPANYWPGIPLVTTNMVDGKWHQIKAQWGVSDINSTTGSLGFDVYIDNLHVLTLAAGSQLTNGLPSTMTSGEAYLVGGQYIAPSFVLNGETPFGYFDEIRISNDLIDDFTFQPYYELRYEDFLSWFRRTRKLDSRTMGLIADNLFTGTIPSTVPIGYKVEDSEIDISSVVGHRTFFDLNESLYSGYYNIENVDLWEDYY